MSEGRASGQMRTAHCRLPSLAAPSPSTIPKSAPRAYPWASPAASALQALCRRQTACKNNTTRHQGHLLPHGWRQAEKAPAAAEPPALSQVNSVCVCVCLCVSVCVCANELKSLSCEIPTLLGACAAGLPSVQVFQAFKSNALQPVVEGSAVSARQRRSKHSMAPEAEGSSEASQCFVVSCTMPLDAKAH